MTEDQLLSLIEGDRNKEIVSGWLDRGDGCAVYRNMAMDSRDLGHRKFVSYGSKAAQLDVDDSGIPDGVPPIRLPDIGGQINWAYQLEATIRRTSEDANASQSKQE